jgi:cytochrome c556
MRASLAPLACISLSACGGPQTSQQNNVQANVSTGSRPAATAASSTLVPSAMSSVGGDQAKALMHERHEGMETIGKANKAIRDQFDSGSPDLAVIRTNAAKIASLSQRASGWFHAGTGPGVGMTGAKDEIWQNPQDFMAKLAAFQKAASVFQTATAGSDLTSAKARLSDMTRTCKACHDKYRRDMHPGSMLNP